MSNSRQVTPVAAKSTGASAIVLRTGKVWPYFQASSFSLGILQHSLARGLHSDASEGLASL